MDHKSIMSFNSINLVTKVERCKPKKKNIFETSNYCTTKKIHGIKKLEQQSNRDEQSSEEHSSSDEQNSDEQNSDEQSSDEQNSNEQSSREEQQEYKEPGDIQSRINNITKLNSSQLNEILIATATAKDAVATIYIYDYMKSKNAQLSGLSWDALNKLEGKNTKIVSLYKVPASNKRTLNPSRRIHKICKGPRLHNRSESAKLIMPQAIEWLSQQQKITKSIVMAKKLAKDINIPFDTARGAITKLKQTGKIRE